MRLFPAVLLLATLELGMLGCGARRSFTGATVDGFQGRLVHDGQPITFPGSEKIQLKVFHETGQIYNIPIQADGSFKIGWMPIGKYTATLLRQSEKDRGPGGKRYEVPGGLTIEDGKTEYTIELGKNWNP